MEELLVELPAAVENLSLPDPGLVTYYRNLEDRTFWIVGDIDCGLLEIAKNIIMFNQKDAMNGINPEDRLPIKIYLFTDGGEVDPTFSLIDTISMSKTPVITINAGLALSSGLLILVAGHKRYAYSHSDTMYHSGSAGFIGDYEKMKASMENYERTIKKIQEHVLSHTTIPHEEFEKNKANDWYFNSEEMIKYGIVDSIINDFSDICI